MKDFFFGIWSIFQGRRRLRAQLNTSRHALEETRAMLAGVQERTAVLANRVNALIKQINDIEDKHQKRTHEYQRLIENLRERIKEKDSTIQDLLSQSK